MYSNQVLKFKGGPKIIKCPPNEMFGQKDEFLMGFAGVAHEMISLMDFFLNPDLGMKIPKTRDTKGLILTKKGIYIFDTPGQWMNVDERFHAIGSGSVTAIGAMHAGASTLEAVKVAAKVDLYTGMGYKTLKL
jgi:ATP-dependent protease HslVU (ClpYQ) peptidase subunit